MKNKLFQWPIAAVFLGVCSFMSPSIVVGAEPSDVCSKELLLAYFPDNFVIETLKKFNVPKDKWEGIVKGLAAKDKDIVKEVEEKASKLNPNPLKDRSPEQRQVAVKIFRESLLDVFGGVLKANGITDEKQIQSMLADIQQQKAKNFAQCMEKQKEQFEKERGSQPEEKTPSATPSATPSPIEPPAAPEPAAQPKNPLSDSDDDSDKSDDTDKSSDPDSQSKKSDESKNQLSDASDDSDSSANTDNSNNSGSDKDSVKDTDKDTDEDK